MEDNNLKIEKRSAKRYQILMPCEIDTEEYGKFSAVIVNISDKGVFVQTYDPLPLGTRVSLFLGKEEGFIVKGVVRSHYFMKYRNSDNPGSYTGMGIHFKYFENSSPPQKEYMLN